MKEKWKRIKGYEEKYEVSNLGRVRNILKNKIKNTRLNNGYEIVDLYKGGIRKTYLVHRLVATAFIPNPNNYNEVNHISGIKSCNCSKNLEWCNRSMNMIHAYKMGLCNKKFKGGDKNVIKLKSI